MILETALPTLSLEDRLIAHGLGCKLTDLPDGSIGSCWAFYRKNVLKLAESHIEKVKVYSQTKGDYVDVKVYPSCEKEVFLAWLRNIYNPEKLPKYLREKMVRDEKPDHVIPAVSAAHRQSLEFSDLPARRLTGREKWAIRNAKDGFIKVGDELALPAPKRLALPASQTPDLFAGVP